MKDTNSLSVYFSTRQPALDSVSPIKHTWVPSLVRIATISWCSHVAIGDEHAVLDVHLEEGTRFVPRILHDTYAQLRPQVAFHLGRRRPVDLTRYEGIGPPSWMRIVIRWLTFGLVPYSGDCLGMVKDVLEQDGIHVPRRITTPGGLERWMNRKAFLRG